MFKERLEGIKDKKRNRRKSDNCDNTSSCTNKVMRSNPQLYDTGSSQPVAQIREVNGLIQTECPPSLLPDCQVMNACCLSMYHFVKNRVQWTSC
jgi:hypothetical protein